MYVQMKINVAAHDLHINYSLAHLLFSANLSALVFIHYVCGPDCTGHREDCNYT